MGMSATQARLLSLTARITDNELRSQMLTNSKLRLADKSSDASSEYMDALNSEKLVFTSYNEDGTKLTSNLTPQLLYTYQPLKNQYGIQNSAGQYLVSGTDAKNYEKSNSLYDFLNCYNLVDDTLYDEYEKEYDVYEDYLEEYQKYLEEYAIYLEELKAYQDSENQTDLYKIFSGAVGTSDIKDGPFPEEKSQQCYWSALQADDQNHCSCYSHVLGHILDYSAELDTCGNNGNGGMYETSAGYILTIGGNPGGYMDNSCNEEMAQVSDGLNEKDASGEYLRYCDGTDDYQGISGITNRLEKAKADYAAGLINETEFNLQVLLSDFIDNGDGTYSIKSLKQKAIDLRFVSDNWGPALTNGDTNSPNYLFTENMLSRETMIDMLINFTDGDMRKLTLGTPPDAPTPPVQVQEPEKPQYDIIVNDSAKAQWYINLWYMMNGSESANKVNSTVNDDGTTLYGVTNNDKNEKSASYKEIDPNLLSSSEWLQFALSNGIVTLSQASYYNPSANSGKQPEMTSEGYTWNSIIYTNATDIVSQEDSAAIAKAEVKYEKAVREIQNEDSKIDQDLKKLDTEHTALQTEYESLKSVIDKNVERSFKAFS